MNKSISYSTHPLAAALEKVLEIVKEENWSGSNNTKQQELLSLIRRNIPSKDFEALTMQTIASRSTEVINSFLASNGFDIKLGELGPNDLGIASILKILMTWKESCEHRIKGQDGILYQGVKIKEEIKLLDSPYSRGYIAQIHSLEGFDIYLTTIPAKPVDEQELFALACKMSKTKNYEIPAKLDSVSFPEVEMDNQPDLSWLLGMSAGQNVITQAVMQTKFKLDKTGAKAEAAVAIAVTRSFNLQKNDLMIDQPFIAWIEKPGIELPVFVAWCDYDSWKK